MKEEDPLWLGQMYHITFELGGPLFFLTLIYILCPWLEEQPTSGENVDQNKEDAGKHRHF